MELGRDLENTTKESEVIEVEVVEVDGMTVQTQADTPQVESHSDRRSDWRQWQGRVTKLDSRWWPLWVILGIIALGLILTLGLVLGVIFVVFRIIRGILRMIFG